MCFLQNNDFQHNCLQCVISTIGEAFDMDVLTLYKDVYFKGKNVKYPIVDPPQNYFEDEAFHG